MPSVLFQQSFDALTLGMHCSDYKNRAQNGLHDSIELPSDPDILIRHLLFPLKPAVRCQITHGKEHGFLFCKRNGDPFESAAEWSEYLQAIVEKHVGIGGVSSNALRHSFTSYMELSEEDDHMRLRESAAYAMRHKIRFVTPTWVLLLSL